MSEISYSAKWEIFCERQDWLAWDRSYRRVAAQEIDWMKNPSGAAEHMWGGYITFRVWQRGKTTELGQFCLELAKQRSVEAVAKDLFERAEPPFGFPRNRLDFLNAKIFIDGFLYQLPLNSIDVLQIAKDEAEVSLTYGPRDWGVLQQSMYQQAIDLLLLVDAREEAKKMIDTARSMRGLHVKELFAVAKHLLKNKVNDEDAARAKIEYRRVFDLLRDPEYDNTGRGHPAIKTQLIIMACIWQKFFEPGEGVYDYERAVALVWE